MQTTVTSETPTAAGGWLDRGKQALQRNPTEFKWLAGIVAVFLLVFFMPTGTARFDNAILEGLALLNWYAREHVMLCLVPAFFIAGAIAVFISQDAVMKYLGPDSAQDGRLRRGLGVGLDPGGLFLHRAAAVRRHLPARRGAGTGSRILVLRPGDQRARHRADRQDSGDGAGRGAGRGSGRLRSGDRAAHADDLSPRRAGAGGDARRVSWWVLLEGGRPLGDTAAFFALQVAVLVFANWAPASAEDSAVWHAIFAWKWPLTALAGIGLAGLLVWRWRWKWQPLAATVGVVTLLAGVFPQHPELAFSAGLIGLTLAAAFQPDDGEEWLSQTWGFAKLILPLLLGGVLLAGFLLGRPGHEGIIPSEWVSAAVGGNSLGVQLPGGAGGGLHVLRHPDRSSDRAGPARLRHGQGTRAGAAIGGAGALIAEHAGHSQHSWHAEDRRLLLAGGGHGDLHRRGVRYVLSIEE